MFAVPGQLLALPEVHGLGLAFLGNILIDVGKTPFFIGRQVTQYLIGLAAAGHELGHFEDTLAEEGAIGLLGVAIGRSAPMLGAGIGLFKLVQDLHIPMLWIPAVWLGLDIGPPHVLLPFGECPGALAGHGAGLASQAAVDVDDECELLFGRSWLEWVSHSSA